jgi:hypothetical protein
MSPNISPAPAGTWHGDADGRAFAAVSAAMNAPDVVRVSGSGAKDKCSYGDGELAGMIYWA